jgi:serine/threonine protein kinase/tetratricopeptide (TPR) repeat protein
MVDVLEVIRASLADRYSVERELGEGGMAIVYLAQDLKHNRQVAIKVFRPEVAAQMGAERFLLEIETAASLSHPHILTVFDSGAAEGLLYYVMPFVEGESLRDRLDREKQLPIEDTMQIAQEVGDALSHAHAQGVVHRDIKPENILIYGGHAVIADFGIAKAVSAAGGERLTSTGMAVGTPTYMSPEQASGEEVDARSDIYALGCLVYEMLVGQPPFTGSTVSAIVSQHVAAPPPSASIVRHTVSEETSSAILKALAKTPADRFSSATAFAKALKVGVSARTVATASASPPWLGVLKVLGVYSVIVAVTFLLLDYLVNRFVLSPHLPNLGTVALLSLFPSVVIFAFQRNRGSIAEWTRLGKVGIPINVAASVAMLVLMFGTKELGAATSSIVVRDEDGNAVERVVPKSEFRKRLVIFYFDPEEADSQHVWYSYGIAGALETDLSQDLFFQLISPEKFASGFQERGYPDGVGLPLTLRRELADDAHVPFFVSGSFTREAGEFKITMTLHETARGKLLAEHTFTGEDMFEVVDRMSLQLKRDLDLPEQYIEQMEDLPVAEVLTGSMSSLEHLMRGLFALMLRSDWQSAAASLERSVVEDPTNALAQYFLYAVSILGNDREKAAAAIQGAMQHMYRLPDRIQFQIKTSYYDFMQQPEKVLAVAKMRIELSPDDIEGRAQLATLHKLRNERDEAIAQYEAILEADPTQYEFLREIAALHRSKGDFDEAVLNYERYAAEFPEDRASYSSLGGLYRMLGQHERAKEYYDRAQMIEPENVSTLVSLALLERGFGHFDAELVQLHEALNLARTAVDSGTVLTPLRRAYSFRGLLSKAIEVLELELTGAEQVSAAVPFLVAQLSTLDLYVRAGRRDDAERKYEAAAAELQPPFDKLSAFGRLAISVELDDPERAELALVDLEEFIQAFGAEALRSRVDHAQGRIHEMRGEYEDAIQSFLSELELDHTNLNVLQDLGRCYRKLGSLDEAEEYLNEARRSVPADPWVLYELALVAAELGDTDVAVERLESALGVWADADPEFREAREAREKLAELRATG